MLAAACVCFLCFSGLRENPQYSEKLYFIECVARCLFSLFFLFAYHRSFSLTLGSQSRFLSLYLMFSIISELRIFTPVSNAISFVYVNPMVSIWVVLFSTLMMIFCLAGYGIYYTSNENSSMTKFLVFAGICSLTVTSVIPKITDTVEIWNLLPVKSLYILLFAVSAVIFIILIFTDAPGSYLIRHFAGLILCVGNALNLFFNTQLMNLIATALTLLGLLIILIIVKKGDVKL